MGVLISGCQFFSWVALSAAYQFSDSIIFPSRISSVPWHAKIAYTSGLLLLILVFVFLGLQLGRTRLRLFDTDTDVPHSRIVGALYVCTPVLLAIAVTMTGLWGALPAITIIIWATLKIDSLAANTAAPAYEAGKAPMPAD